MLGSGILSSRNEYSLDHRYAIHRACRDGDIIALDELLRRIPTDGALDVLKCADSFYGWMPIHWAAHHGQVACLQKLLTYASSSMNSGWTSLIDIRANNFCQTPIHLAAHGNHVECLKWLLDAGASLRLTDSLGETAAHKAARCGGMESLNLLTTYGINLNVTNNAGQTAIDVAAIHGHSQCIAYLQHRQALQNEAFNDCTLSPGQDNMSMDIDQTNTLPAFVNGSYGYQPSFHKPGLNGRKRLPHGEFITANMNGDKRSKKMWTPDDPAKELERSRVVCAVTKTRDLMSGHCVT